MNWKSLAAVLAAWAIAVPANAQQLKLEVELGALYDSHLTFEEADIEREEGDFGASFTADVELKALDTKTFDLGLGYRFDQTVYAEFDEFNLQSHRIKAGAQVKVGGARLGLDYHFAHIRLGGDELYNEHGLSPSVSGFVAENVYLRGFYRYFDRDFVDLNPQDAEGHAIGASMLRFFDSKRGYVAANASRESEDARDPAFDFDGFQVGTNARVPLGQNARSPLGKVGLSYRQREYDSITPSIGARRSEDRWRANAGTEVPVTRTISFEGDYQYTDRASNFSTADYREHRVLGSLIFKLN